MTKINWRKQKTQREKTKKKKKIESAALLQGTREPQISVYIFCMHYILLKKKERFYRLIDFFKKFNK